MRMKAAVATSLIVLGIASCGQASEPAGTEDVYFPSYEFQGGGPAGARDGTLVESGGCLFWEGDQGNYLPIWSNATFSLKMQDGQPAVAYPGGVLEVGSHARLAGGGWSLSQAEELLGSSIPQRCQAAGYWIASDVVES